MGTDKDKAFYNFDLNIKLETEIDLYEQDRQNYWKNQGGWSAIEYDRAERFSEAVLRNSEQLIPVEEIEGDMSKLSFEINRIKKVSEFVKRVNEIAILNLPWDKKIELIREVAKECPPDPQDNESPLRLVWERFIINMSWAAIDKIVEGASRIFQLYGLVLTSTPSKSTQQFLGRLSRCYIWGFDPECVILCRAVMDTAFKDNIAYETCEKNFGKPRRGGFSLSDRIQVAMNEGIIDGDIAEKARNVKERGDIAVHRQPDITKDVWCTICDTVAVLERIIQRK